MSKMQSARHLGELYEKGVICGGVVFGEFLAHVSERNVDQWMSSLSPELLARFRNSLQNFNPDPADYVSATADDIKKWRYAVELMRVWLRGRESESGVSPNGGSADFLGDSDVSGGPSSVS